MELRSLTVEDVLQIHEVLVEDFARTNDPIVPPGVKSAHLLASAVSRQHTGMGATLKYPQPVGNAASLLYGLCNDHPFHNGNKRTALVAMLVHLDKNKLMITNTRSSELFDMILGVANHTFGLRTPDIRRSRRKATSRRDSDDEVASIRVWLAHRSARVTRGEYPITIRQLRAILDRFGYVLENPKGNYIDVSRVETVRRGLTRKEVTTHKHLGKIGYPSEGTEVAIKDIKHVRRLCGLTEEDGVDSASFYDANAIVDGFINKYRTVLRRLAHR